MGDVESARYEPALLPPCPTIASWSGGSLDRGSTRLLYRHWCRTYAIFFLKLLSEISNRIVGVIFYYALSVEKQHYFPSDVGSTNIVVQSTRHVGVDGG